MIAVLSPPPPDAGSTPTKYGIVSSNSLGIPVNAYKGGTHASLRQTLIELRPANKQLKAIAYRLASFHQLRIIADYKLEDKVTEISAKESIENCKKILDQLDLVTSL